MPANDNCCDFLVLNETTLVWKSDFSPCLLLDKATNFGTTLSNKFLAIPNRDFLLERAVIDLFLSKSKTKFTITTEKITIFLYSCSPVLQRDAASPTNVNVQLFECVAAKLSSFTILVAKKVCRIPSGGAWANLL